MPNSHPQESISEEQDWKGIEDRVERRRVQNKNAQRRHRSKKRNEEEEKARIADHQQAAGSAYTAARKEDLATTQPTGLPWGSVPVEQIFDSNKPRPKFSQQDTREGSVASGSNRSGTTGYRSVRPYYTSSLGIENVYSPFSGHESSAARRFLEVRSGSPWRSASEGESLRRLFREPLPKLEETSPQDSQEALEEAREPHTTVDDNNDNDNDNNDNDDNNNNDNRDDNHDDIDEPN